MKVQLPEFLSTYEPEAKALCANGCVHEIEFSGSTYQVHVVDKKKGLDVWTFLQLDPHGSVVDRFCSCEDSLESASCVHLAASFLRIFNGHLIPLHERFEGSLWNYLCQLYAEKVGYEAEVLTRQDPFLFMYRSVSGKPLFSIQAKSEQVGTLLEDLIGRRRKETEETSLKFSNLSESEIALWRQGRPSSRLLYELSFWSDLAKWLMLMQENRELIQIDFAYSASGFPNRLTAFFPSLEVMFYLSEANLPGLVPRLATVKSPLVVQDFAHNEIKDFTYDEETGVLHIHRMKQKARASSGKQTKARDGVRVGDWIYVQEVGFFARANHKLLSVSELSGDELSELLQGYLPLVQRYLKGQTVHAEPMVLSYQLHFDTSWNLHIEGYLFHPGDLQKAHSRDFGDWVFLEGDGFYRVVERPFGDIQKLVRSQDVGDFVTEHRVWLSLQPGFGPHLAGLEAELTYTVDENWFLRFSSRTMIDDEVGGNKDFGAWIYVAGKGFFSKIARASSLSPLRPGAVIPEPQVGLFIRIVHDELQFIPGFFRKECPISALGLRISLTKRKGISISPQYVLAPGVSEDSVHYFGEFVYVAGEGFHEVPASFRLPEAYSTPMEISKKDAISFLLQELPGLKSRVLELDPRLQTPSFLHLTVHAIERRYKEGYEWYATQLSYKTDLGSLPIWEVWQAVQKKERLLFSTAGMLDLQQRQFDWLRSLKADRIDEDDHEVTLSILELLKLHALHDLQAAPGETPEARECREVFTSLMALEEREAPNLTGLGSELRGYQMAGVRWLWSLYEHRLSGLLCDDMGLGKTHQAMGLIRAIMNAPKSVSEPSRILVICPTSVIYHWQEKLATYLPGVVVTTYYGIGRTVEGFADRGGILLTTYGLWRRDYETLKNVAFDLAVFDEVQMAKTHTSRLHAALLAVKSTMRLGMSGTPVENRLRELKALFDVVLPSYMPGEKEYRDFFLKPIERNDDVARRVLLRKFIHPFVLRRRKTEVLQDLPEKTEEIVHCQLSQQQQQLYQEALALSRPAIMQQMSERDQPVPYLHIFALLSRLKQICNHPAAFLKKIDDYRQYHSGKWELFLELLHEARASGQKVVVFSQYLTMLDLFERYMKDHDIEFASIRGATMDRGAQIQRFNREPSCEVFLGSIQAGGLGIDLTAGSVVIHYDRWWNAARENQATDRVHRIGQTRGVQVFKLVTKGTFEERIDQMITAKGKLMEDVVGVDDQEALKRFNRDELMKLLQDVDTLLSGESEEEATPYE